MTGISDQPIQTDQLLAESVRIARSAGTFLTERFRSDFSIGFKGASQKGETDLVTEVDRASQDLIEREIRSRYPDHGILAEEDLDLKGDSDFIWIVDPLDGTTNYVHGFPVFSVSIAVTFQGKAVCGVVFNPVSGELFQGKRGGGATLNLVPINVSDTNLLERSLLGTGFPYDIRRTKRTNLDHFSRFAVRTQGIRRCGSAALDLCCVAAGRLDGFWELNLKPWDVAAGALIVSEAGGRITDFSNRPYELSGEQILASNGLIHIQMLDVLGGSPGQGQDEN